MRPGIFDLSESIDIARDVDTVFAAWSRVEDFPKIMRSVHRTRRIGDQSVLWDVDVAGRQVVWEARVVECVPGRRLRWESCWGARNFGEVRFERLPGANTRLRVEIGFEPRTTIERLGSRLGLPGFHVRQELDAFRRSVEGRRELARAS